VVSAVEPFGNPVMSIRPCPLPDCALLDAYRANGAYTDCYAADVAGSITHEQFVTAFYTTLLFKLERQILRWTVSRPSTDAQAGQLAAGSIDEFSAWRVEARCTDQLLMSDLYARTRSWLMVTSVATSNEPATRLYFGSAVVPSRNRATGQTEMGLAFRALLGFHKIYSVLLLRAAMIRLKHLHTKPAESNSRL
jgi:hypothetical protein